MNTFLNTIINSKKEEVEQLKACENEDTFQRKIESAMLPHYPFSNAIKITQSKPALIAEVKKASPSKGVIRENFDPIQIAKNFDAHNATCLSVLTETNYFLGNPHYIADIKAHIKKPILRKDFILDPLQVWESKALGADAILLIKALLTSEECAALISLAHQLHLNVLLEVHSETEVMDCKGLTPDLVGINNRNLDTFDVDIQTAITLTPLIQSHFPNALIVAESGYSKQSEIATLNSYQLDAVLIGEGLAKHPALIDFWNNHES